MDIEDKGQLFDKLIKAVDIKDKKSTFDELWIKAEDELFSMMAPAHIEHVVKGLKAIRKERETGIKREPDNLTDVAAEMLFFHVFDKIHHPDINHPLFLPHHVGRIYLENAAASAIIICKICGYWYSGPHFKDCPYCESCL